MFLAEGREHLQELNLAVVRIEETPDDPETVDEIFRIAHSMKGMSATMGFAGMAALTHEMEDVFELLRQRRGGLERAAIDVLFECLDALSAAVEAIDRTGAEEIEPQALIERLQGLVRERTPVQEAQRAGAAPAPDNLAELADGRRVVQITAILDEDVSMPSVRAYMVLSAIAELGETLACRPSPDERRRLRRPRGRRVGRLRPRRLRARRRRRLRARGRRRDRLRGRPDAALDEPDELIADDAAVAPEAAPPTRPGRRARARRGEAAREERLLDRPRRRRAAGSADALHGRARPAPHAGRGARRRRRRAGPLAGHAEPHALVARAAVDGHAGPDDPGGGRLPALPAARARPLDQARQAGRPAARRQGHRARPHRRRRARRPARAPRPQLARPRPRRARGAHGGRQARDRRARDLRPARRRQRRHHRPRRRPRHRSPPRRGQGRRARADRARGRRRRSTASARSSCSSRPASRPPRSRATSPAAASAWTPCARRSAGSAARS